MGTPKRVLLTGASGYLGSLIAVSLLLEEDVSIVAPIRAGRDAESVLGPLRAEFMAQGSTFDASHRHRLHITQLPEIDQLATLDAELREHRITEVIHCAGCLDYFDRPNLEAVNVRLTAGLLQQAQRLGVERFVYISTAFSSGYVTGTIAETLHEEPLSDPTDYTRTKREAERLVVDSGLPYQIIRPSVVIGDSRDGHYIGKRYGLYQLWSGIERLLCRAWHPEIHTFANDQPASLIHQDAFQSAFLALHRLPVDSSLIINLVSRADVAPTMKQLWQLWCAAVNRPNQIVFYEHMADIPTRSIPSSQRALIALASVNLEISGHPWLFETTQLERLRSNGLQFPDATRHSVLLCQQRFVAQSATIEKFMAKYSDQFPPEPSVAQAAVATAEA